jgi:hypothetical protein
MTVASVMGQLGGTYETGTLRGIRSARSVKSTDGLHLQEKFTTSFHLIKAEHTMK